MHNFKQKLQNYFQFEQNRVIKFAGVMNRYWQSFFYSQTLYQVYNPDEKDVYTMSMMG